MKKKNQPQDHLHWHEWLACCTSWQCRCSILLIACALQGLCSPPEKQVMEKVIYKKKKKFIHAQFMIIYCETYNIFIIFSYNKKKGNFTYSYFFFFSVRCFFIFCLHNNKNNKNKQRKKGSHQQNQESSFQLLRRETHTWLLMEMCKAPPMSKWGTFDKARVSCMTPCPDRAASPWTFIHRGERILGK